jgi:hypothetical protein
LRTKKSFPDQEKELQNKMMRNPKRNLCEIMRNYAKSMRNEAKFVSRISFIGFRKQVAGRACQEKCGDSAKKVMEKCKLYLDFSVDLCYDNTIEKYGRMKNAPT